MHSLPSTAPLSDPLLLESQTRVMGASIGLPSGATMIALARFVWCRYGLSAKYASTGILKTRMSLPYAVDVPQAENPSEGNVQFRTPTLLVCAHASPE